MKYTKLKFGKRNLTMQLKAVYGQYKLTDDLTEIFSC